MIIRICAKGIKRSGNGKERFCFSVVQVRVWLLTYIKIVGNSIRALPYCVL